MKRFIRYLYEYEQGKKLRNVGFVKAEQGVEDCVLHIHGKGLNLGETKVLKLYLFFVRGWRMCRNMAGGCRECEPCH